MSPAADERSAGIRVALTAGAILGTSAIAVIAVVRAVQAGRTGSFDPSLASRMGSDAVKFPIQLAYVVTFSAILASIGFVVGTARHRSSAPLMRFVGGNQHRPVLRMGRSGLRSRGRL